MDLQNGNYYWPTTVEDPPSFPRLEENIKCDVLIIGGGSSGAQTAYMLADSGLDVVVVEKNSCGQGSTTTNTALIQYAGDKTFKELINSFGENIAIRHLKNCEKVINQMESIAGKLTRDISFKRRDSLYCASDEAGVREISEEYALYKKYGFDILHLTEDQIAARYPFKRKSGLYFLNDAEMNPLAFTYGLLEEAVSKGVRVFEHTMIKGKKPTSKEVTVFTDKEYKIIAKQVIVAAGYEGLEFKHEKNTVISSTYSIVTCPVQDLSPWYKQTLLWETARPYIYARTTPDNRIIIGGLDESYTKAEERDKKLLNKSEQLLTECQKLFPQFNIQTEYKMASFYGGTHDGMPIIGCYEDQPNIYYLYAYGDNGTVYNMVFANIISSFITKGSHPDLELYLQSRPTQQKPFAL
ncbi:NAD(P)/FAD-dependent oxidoreductase [Alkalihalophilus marmarensis]|jgi:glycine/D-amino acid oxidase-like deaminating enzyme|uniref:FAD dependent oxidoreductase domain-containing protein n=1 Tax=Alkalihalophilus marmarensis DSM 21297 TaxID=1188261 RepID=U6SSA6_9BACI|nr:FAD-dependent oxidoreductase [Alkalihalophilus marmarensis]ERN54589.1 hypothetical protein A33I_04400 [Alkalihalophilus marmarensis DSM 21297]